MGWQGPLELVDTFALGYGAQWAAIFSLYVYIYGIYKIFFILIAGPIANPIAKPIAYGITRGVFRGITHLITTGSTCGVGPHIRKHNIVENIFVSSILWCSLRPFNYMSMKLQADIKRMVLWSAKIEPWRTYLYTLVVFVYNNLGSKMIIHQKPSSSHSLLLFSCCSFNGPPCLKKIRLCILHIKHYYYI